MFSLHQGWDGQQFCESSRYCGFADSSLSRPKNSNPNMKTSLAALLSYPGPLYLFPYPQTPLSLTPQTLSPQGESVSCGSFPQAPAEKAISLGVWLGGEKNRNQDCLGPETIQVLLHPLQSQLTLNEHPSGKRPRFTLLCVCARIGGGGRGDLVCLFLFQPKVATPSPEALLNAKSTDTKVGRHQVSAPLVIEDHSATKTFEVGPVYSL